MRAALSCICKQLTEIEKIRDPVAHLCGCRELTDPFRRLVDVRLLLGGARAERTPDRVTLCARSGAHSASALHDHQD